MILKQKKCVLQIPHSVEFLNHLLIADVNFACSDLEITIIQKTQDAQITVGASSENCRSSW